MHGTGDRRSKRFNAQGSVATVVLGVLSVGVITGVAVSMGRGGEPLATETKVAANLTKPKPKLARRATSAELRQALARVGINPTLLALAGVNGEGAANAVSNARQHLTNTPEVVSSADAAFASAQGTVDRLERLIQQGQSNEQDRAAFATAKQTLVTAQAERDAAVAALRSAALASLSPEQRTLATTVLGNHNWKLPPRYLTVNRSDAEWVTLRDAYANAQAVARRGGEANPELAAALAAADTATSAAATNLATNIQAVRAAFNTAVAAE